MSNLGRVLAQRGQLDEAEMWLRRAGDTGDTTALLDLGRILAQHGRLDEAEMWLRRAVDAGDTAAMSDLEPCRPNAASWMKPRCGSAVRARPVTPQPYWT